MGRALKKPSVAGKSANLPPVILASVSPRRSELLQRLGLKFQVIQSDAPEIHSEELTASEVSQINAYRKARAVAKKFPDALVIAADTLVCLDTTLFGKPASMAEAHEMLEKLGGRAHQVVTGVCLLNLRSHRQKVFADITEVTFRPLNAGTIQSYLAKINPLDKAGGYAIQEGGDVIVEKISGSYSNVVGLPIERLQKELEAW
jgi:septum formation protein